MTHSTVDNSIDGVAIIGMAGIFPGASSIEQFWKNISEGVESITFFSDSDLDLSIDRAVRNLPNYIRARGVIPGAEMFDADFFRMSPREAEIMDPQQRIFLEIAWQALEDGGYDPDSYRGLISVYGGSGLNTYFPNHISQRRDLVDSFGKHQTDLANAPDYLATRVSYKLNLRGPSVSMYTGCSLSLVAVCHAFDSLMSHQSDMALAGGSFVECPQNSGYLYEEGEIYSSDGHCRPFDAKATGTVFSNGAGIVLLKRVEDALQDRDNIYAVIRGTAINNDGSNKVSFAAPSVNGQAEVIAMAQANAGVNPESVSYIETHGTGTPVGDPIEITALTKAFRAGTDASGYCAVGSLKANIGHLDAAAGVAGLIKTALMLKNRQIPPSINFNESNPRINFQESPFYVNTQLKDWEPSGVVRRAGVSSFGVGGTNAHVVLEEAPEIKTNVASRSRQLLVLSTRTNTTLDSATGNLVSYIRQHPKSGLADTAYTLQVGRNLFNQRRFLVCEDRDDALSALESMDPKRVKSSSGEPGKRSVAFIFSGQGSQYVNMGYEVYRTESLFRETVNQCAAILRPHVDYNLLDIMYPDEADFPDASEKLLQTAVTQPALFTIEYALAKMWMKWGINPDVMVGHSIGEYVAACLSGVFSLEDALELVAARGRLIQGLSTGSMLAVFLSEEELQPLLEADLCISVINGPSLCVVSGEKTSIEAFKGKLSQKNITYRDIHTSHAFHSATMDPILDIFRDKVDGYKLNIPQIPFVSNVTGTWITEEQATNPEYWSSHLRKTVRFSDCLHELFQEPNRIFLEVGPGRTFGTLALQHPDRNHEQVVLTSMRHPKDAASDISIMLNTLGELWMAGVPVDWSGFYETESRRRLSLPTYPFERQRYWCEATGKQSSEYSPKFEPLKTEEGVDTKVISEATPVAETIPSLKHNHVESKLADIWKITLGIKGVSYNDNFFDLGGSSLMAVRVFNQIEKSFNKRLPLAVLMEAPTIEELARIIRDEKPVTSLDSLVKIHSGTSEFPLFLVHAAGGNLLIYRSLIKHLGPDLTVYGLQARGMNGEKPFHTRIEDMAAQYVQEIQTVQPRGPYLLLGYCMGGTIALEMAQQFYSQGEEVALLGIMETYDFSKEPTSFLSRLRYRAQQVEFHARNLLIAKNKRVFLHEKAKVAWSRRNLLFGNLYTALGFGTRLGNYSHSILSDIWEACDMAAMEYTPRPYSGFITQFRPIKHYASFSGPEMGLEKIAAGGMENINLHVYPRGMLVEPFVRDLAEALKRCLYKSLERYHQ
jgi:phthiocerol/phenolphthiocerol synthesis type-I polyketide synthase E